MYVGIGNEAREVSFLGVHKSDPACSVVRRFIIKLCAFDSSPLLSRRHPVAYKEHTQKLLDGR
jgi:hypothetical protein